MARCRSSVTRASASTRMTRTTTLPARTARETGEAKVLYTSTTKFLPLAPLIENLARSFPREVIISIVEVVTDKKYSGLTEVDQEMRMLIALTQGRWTSAD